MLEYADDRPWPGSSGWSDETSRRALEVIASGVDHLTGYAVCCVNVVHRGMLRAVAVCGSAEQRMVLMDSHIPVAVVEAELDRAVGLGRFQFIAADSASSGRQWGATFGGTHDAGPDAWDAEDFMLAPIRDAAGEMVGLLSIDLPVSGRRPATADIERLDRYAALVEGAVLMALDHDEQRERIQMARAARQVVSAATRSLSMADIFDESASALIDGFVARGVWMRTFDQMDPFSAARSRDGVVPEIPDVLISFSERVARRDWARQEVTVISREHADAGPYDLDADDDLDDLLDYLDGIGAGSVMYVPVGAGTECLGCLALCRPAAARRWSTVETETARDIGMDLGRAIANARAFAREQRAVHELQALNAYKSQLVTTLSHELKTPLASILGNLELLETVGLETEDGHRGLSALNRGTTRLVKVVDDLMLLAKVGDPTYELVVRPVDLAEVVGDVLELTASTAAQQGIEVELASPQPVYVLGDPTELDRAVVNLVSNALKYTPPGGRVQLFVEQQGDEAMLTCSDTGIGISADDLPLLFREFFRSTNPAAQARSGTGLGLAIVERIARRHQGRIEVDSLVGDGSTFRFVLPAAPTEAEPESRQQAVARG